MQLMMGATEAGSTVALFELLATLLALAVGGAMMYGSYRKGKPGLCWLGLLSFVFPLVGVCRLAKPGSPWFENRYAHAKRKRAWERFESTPYESSIYIANPDDPRRRIKRAYAGAGRQPRTSGRVLGLGAAPAARAFSRLRDGQSGSDRTRVRLVDSHDVRVGGAHRFVATVARGSLRVVAVCRCSGRDNESKEGHHRCSRGICWPRLLRPC